MLAADCSARKKIKVTIKGGLESHTTHPFQSAFPLPFSGHFLLLLCSMQNYKYYFKFKNIWQKHQEITEVQCGQGMLQTKKEWRLNHS